MREAIIKSLKAAAADLVRYMGSQVKVERTISKIQMVYKIVASFDILMQLFYKIIQDLNEKIPAYTTRIKGALNQMRLKYTSGIDSAAMEGHLKE